MHCYVHYVIAFTDAHCILWVVVNNACSINNEPIYFNFSFKDLNAVILITSAMLHNLKHSNGHIV